MRSLTVAIALAMCACGSSVPVAAPPPSAAPGPPASALTTAPAPAPAGPFEGLPSLDALSARGPAVAAGMHEVVRGEIMTGGGAAERAVVQAVQADTCLRVTVAAAPAVHAWLTNARGDRLADEKDVTSALLDALGPVCTRKGDTVTLHLEARDAFSARFVAWSSP